MARFSASSSGNRFVNGVQTVVADKVMPNACEQLSNAAVAASKIVRSKFASVGEEEQAERYSICLGCEQLSESGRCFKCGCFMKMKTRFKEMRCPLGKW